MTQMESIARAMHDTNDRARNGLILIIDDEADWIAECGFMLQSFGYQSLSADTAEEAIVQIADDRISTVIIDYSMPGCDGLTLLHELSARAAADGRQLSFIMATGHATMELAVGAMRASAVDFLQKPVSRDDLQKALLRVSGVQNTPPARSALVDKLAGLSAEMNRLASLIGGDPTTAFNTAPRPAPPPPGSPMRQHGQVTADFIRGLLRIEAKRRKLGNGVLFGDPAWDMLLDLLLAKLEGRLVSVSSACIASGAPTTTALRLVNRLVGDEILCRIPDERDGRRDFLVINPEIETPLLAYLDELAHS